jgi:acetyl esterase/lipase
MEIKRISLPSMKLLLLSLFTIFALFRLDAQTNVWQPSPGHVQILLWPGTPPDAQPCAPEYVTNASMPEGKSMVWVSNVSRPTMTVYSPSGTNTGIAMLVFPGGGYQGLAMDLEGTEICDWLNSQGITAVLLKYRVPLKEKEPYSQPTPQALEDAQRALSLVRYHAAEWGIDPHRLGVIGFSAGGHLVAATSTHFDQRSYAPVDAADRVSCRPDFAIGCYPGHLCDEDNGFNLNPNVPVTTNTPPTFLLMAEDDHVDHVEQSLTYYIALKKAGVPVEMHLYAHGGHGFGLRPTKYPITGWPRLVETWLHTIGMLQQ